MPGVYWLAVVLISVVGTLITDNLVDNFGVRARDDDDRSSPSRSPSTFAVWYARERTLSIHTIVTTTPRGVLLARRSSSRSRSAPRPATSSPRSFDLGYWNVGAPLRRRDRDRLRCRGASLGLNAVLAFWVAYILTRPLGASIGDWLSQPTEDGGLGLGTTSTSLVFLMAIGALVAFLTVTKRDRTADAVSVPA